MKDDDIVKRLSSLQVESLVGLNADDLVEVNDSVGFTDVSPHKIINYDSLFDLRARTFVDDSQKRFSSGDYYIHGIPNIKQGYLDVSVVRLDKQKESQFVKRDVSPIEISSSGYSEGKDIDFKF